MTSLMTAHFAELDAHNRFLLGSYSPTRAGNYSCVGAIGPAFARERRD